MNEDIRLRIIALEKAIVQNPSFLDSEWKEMALLVDAQDLVNGHPRLLRSLGFHDPDYPAQVLDVLQRIVTVDPASLERMERFVADGSSGIAPFQPVDVGVGTIVVRPSVFRIMDVKVEKHLVAVMMPFDASFNRVYLAIEKAAKNTLCRCRRADQMWTRSEIIQEIFDLIRSASAVVVDLTGKNPNVFYEMGIAHTLGKIVIPIAQSVSEIPFDIAHHRVLPYLPNEEGLSALTAAIANRFETAGVGVGY